MNEKEFKKAELINWLMYLERSIKDLYEFHPSNPNKKDIEECYDKLVIERETANEELKELF
jgi:hypothetical protein